MSMVALINNKLPQGISWPESLHDYIRVPAYLNFLSHGKKRRELSILYPPLPVPSLPNKLPAQTIDTLTAACFFISGAMSLLMHHKFLLRASLFIVGVCSIAANTWLTYCTRYFLDTPAHFKDKETAQLYFELASKDPLVAMAEADNIKLL